MALEDTEVNGELDRLSSSRIEHLDIDIMRKRITIQTRGSPTGEPTVHTLVFEGVLSFYYARGIYPTHRVANTEPSTEVDWNLGGHEQHGTARIQLATLSDPWAGKFRSTPNFGIELGGRAGLFIEASKVTIDGREFDVGYADPELLAPE